MASKNRFKFPAWCTTPSDDFSACTACAGNSDCVLQTSHQILVASKGFFYTYELLLKDSAYPWFVRSQEERARRLRESVDKLDQPSLLHAIVVNGSMATELALKYLTYRDAREFVQTHRLDLLLNNLPSKDRQEILSRLEKRAGMSEEVCEKAIAIFSNAFTEARYFFSPGNNKGISFLFDDFVRVVHEYAIEVFYQELTA